MQVVVAIEQSFKLHAFGRVLGISNPKQLSGVGIGCVARHLRQETKLLNE